MLSDERVKTIMQLRGNKFSEVFVRQFDKEWTETVAKFKRRNGIEKRYKESINYGFR